MEQNKHPTENQINISINSKGKRKVYIWRNRGKAPCILNLITRWKRVVTFTPASQYPLDGRLAGPCSPSGCCREEKNYLHLPGIDPLPNCHASWAILALTIFCMIKSNTESMKTYFYEHGTQFEYFKFKHRFINIICQQNVKVEYSWLPESAIGHDPELVPSTLPSSEPLSLWSILMIFTHLLLGNSRGHLPIGFPITCVSDLVMD